MAKHHVFLHIGHGTPDIGERVRDELSLAGICTPDISGADVERAELEILRRHKDAGLKRREVEGAWAHVCRRTFRVRENTFVSAPSFIDATPEQAALALDSLAGLKVHVIVSDGAEVPAAWSDLVPAKRVHSLPTGLDDSEFGAAIARLALVDQQDRLSRKLAKLDKLRTKAELKAQSKDKSRDKSKALSEAASTAKPAKKSRRSGRGKDAA